MTRPADVEALKQLALLGGLDGPVEIASGDFATLLDASQQTASRRLIELTEEGLITREMGVRKQRVHVTADGRALLEAEHHVYRRLFEGEQEVRIQGVVTTGLGEGRYYLSRPGYQARFETTLGWVPYPGTLNLSLDGAETNKLRILKRRPVHVIEGFQAEGRTFGGVTCYPASVGDQACAAILPHRTHYSTTLELIAPVCLREVLPCRDDDRLDVTVRLAGPGHGD